MSLQAYRGLLAVGRLLDDPALVARGRRRLDGFAERGFYHDGFWRQGDAAAHRRVVGPDRRLDRPAAGRLCRPARLRIPVAAADGLDRSGVDEVPMLALARAAGDGGAEPTRGRPRSSRRPGRRRRPGAPGTPVLLGGVGLARLAVGEGAAALDLELRGQDSLGAPHFQRQALRLAVGGRPVLGDLDDSRPRRPAGTAPTASHNTVVVDGLNQRESLGKAPSAGPGRRFPLLRRRPRLPGRHARRPPRLPAVDDPVSPDARRGRRAARTRTPSASSRSTADSSTTRSSTPRPARRPAGRLSVPMGPGPATLLPPSIPYVADRTGRGRPLVRPGLRRVRAARPGSTDAARRLAWLDRPGWPGRAAAPAGRLPTDGRHGHQPRPDGPGLSRWGIDSGRAGLILRRRSQDGAHPEIHLRHAFSSRPARSAPSQVGRVRVDRRDGRRSTSRRRRAPSTRGQPRARDRRRRSTLGRRPAAPDRRPGRPRLQPGPDPGGRDVRRVGRPAGRAAAGDRGRSRGVVRHASRPGRGWFVADETVPTPDAPLAGRTLLIRHGDGRPGAGPSQRVENMRRRPSAHVVARSPDSLDRSPHRGGPYYQFPRDTAPDRTIPLSMFRASAGFAKSPSNWSNSSEKTLKKS